MKKILFIVLAILITQGLFADKTAEPKVETKKRVRKVRKVKEESEVSTERVKRKERKRTALCYFNEFGAGYSSTKYEQTIETNEYILTAEPDSESGFMIDIKGGVARPEYDLFAHIKANFYSMENIYEENITITNAYLGMGARFNVTPKSVNNGLFIEGGFGMAEWYGSDAEEGDKLFGFGYNFGGGFRIKKNHVLSLNYFGNTTDKEYIDGNMEVVVGTFSVTYSYRIQTVAY